MLAFESPIDLRLSVQFEQANILGERFEFGADPYDFIFCRNLLIYFYPEAQDLVLRKLRQLLTADGLLFVGAAETSLLTATPFILCEVADGVCLSEKRSGAFCRSTKTEISESSVARQIPSHRSFA